MKNAYEGSLSFDKHSIAAEAMLQAEMDYESNLNLYDEMVSEGLIDDSPFTAIAYKDDDGFYRVTGRSEKFNTYEDLSQIVGDI